MSKHIWIKIGIVLGFLIIEKFRAGESCMRICISGGQINNLGTLNFRSVSRWGGWRARQWQSRLWSRLSASVEWSCTCSFASPACLRILCGAIFSWKAARRLVLTKHCRVSLYRSLHLFVPRELNTPLLLFSDLGAGFLNEVFRFLDRGARKAFFGHFGHILGQAHVGLFQLYTTSLPCHSC